MTMSALPKAAKGPESGLPDYLPARMANEYTYCPRLFYYEWVEGLFRESADTLEGKFQHGRVDDGSGALPASSEEERIHARSVTLSSDRLRAIAKMDLVELDGETATPVDYKHGRPRETENGIEPWPADRVQIAVQGLILRDNGYRCGEGVIYFVATRQRVRVPLEEEVIAEAEAAVRGAWAAAAGTIPPPLEDSPKCPGCSLAGICLPDETVLLETEPTADGEPIQLSLFGTPQFRKPPGRAVRQLLAPRSDKRPVYLNTQGLRVGKSGEVLVVKEKDQVKQEIRMGEICQLNLMGNVQLSTQAVQALCEAGVPVCYFSMGGWFYGITTGLNAKNVFTRQAQFKLAADEGFSLALARRLVAGKVRNQRTLLQRNHVEPSADALLGLKQMAEAAERAREMQELLGIEGNAARIYFGQFDGMLKAGEDGERSEFTLDFEGRNRRPPRDPVNALLSLAYSVLAKDYTIACQAVGLDPYLGFYHQPRFGRSALALDLVEPFRPLVGDSAVLTAINTRMITTRDFVRAGDAVALTPGGRKAFFRAYEARMDTLVTHPIFEYRVSYRRLLEIQARLLMRLLDGEIHEYPVFVTR